MTQILSQAASVYQKRRRQLSNSLASGVVLFPSASIPRRNYGQFPADFRQSSHVLYFSGLTLPNSALAIDIDAGKTVLFTGKMTEDEKVWHDARPSFAEILAATEVSAVRDIAEWADYLAELRSSHRTLHVAIAGQVEGVGQSLKLVEAMTKLRCIKSEFELSEMRQAMKVTSRAHQLAMAVTAPGSHETEIQAMVEAVFRAAHGAPSYSPIATCRGEVLHACLPHRKLEAGQMFLLDAGCELQQGYATDITRTWPVSGKFNPIQKQLYEIVLESQRQAIARCRVGVCYSEVHKTASLAIVDGLKEIGLLRGERLEIYERDAHALFFPHGVGHLIGLDVHDLEDLGEDKIGYEDPRARETEKLGRRHLRLKRRLEAGFVVTVEPGIYFIEAYLKNPTLRQQFAEFINFDKASELLGFGGIRIEDNVFVTDAAAVVLSAAIPKTIAEIESLVGTKAGLLQEFRLA